MYGCIVLFTLVLFHACSARSYYDEEYYEDTTSSWNLRSKTKTYHLNETLFPSLENYEIHSVPTTESQHPWIARVVHSRTADIPHMCTAVCVDERIFITAARCIASLKVYLTTIIYKGQRLPASAFVLPSKTTKQWFEDIGCIVVDSAYTGPWTTIGLLDSERTTTSFEWFHRLNLTAVPHRAVGYAMKKNHHRVKDAANAYNLVKLDVTIDIEVCSQIFTLKHLKGFYVPCYLTCPPKSYTKKSPRCKKYLGAEGTAVFSLKTNKLIGIATWGAYFDKYELPVGFAVPNSDSFKEDYACARKIRDDENEVVAHGYYQTLCNK